MIKIDHRVYRLEGSGVLVIRREDDISLSPNSSSQHSIHPIQSMAWFRKSHRTSDGHQQTSAMEGINMYQPNKLLMTEFWDPPS